MLRVCACDIDGFCPYGDGSGCNCEMWCGEPESQDDPDLWEEPDWDLDEGFNPYLGEYDFDC